MYLVVIKLIEVLARAVFTVGCTFALPLASAGQFGILITLIGLFAFGFGWERHIDLQRRMVGQPEVEFDFAVSEALWLYLFNYIVMLPIFILLALNWAEIGPDIMIFAVVVVISEHIASQLYNITLVQPRYYRPITIVAIKNLLIVSIVGFSLLFNPDLISLEWVMKIWAGLSAAGTFAIALFWYLIRKRKDVPRTGGLWQRIFAQHRASRTHFLIGLLAILILQFDRLAVGSLLSLEETGIYFRNILLVSFAYQFFNIASYNRILPRIFGKAKTHNVAHVLKIVYRELTKVALAVVGALAGLMVLNYLSDNILVSKFKVDIMLVGLLLMAAMFRISADFHGLLINAKMREDLLLRCQIVAFSIGSVLLISLTYIFGMFGTAVASGVTAISYLILNRVTLMRLPEEPS